MASNPEELLISAVLNTRDHTTPMANGISVDHFHAYPDEWKYIEDYIEDHKRVPSAQMFRRKFPNFFPTKGIDDVPQLIEEVKGQSASNELLTAMDDAVELIRTGDVKRALKMVHTAALQAESSLVGRSDDGDIITDFEDIYQEAEKRKKRFDKYGMAGIPTGFPTLDQYTGGPQPGQVWVVSARLGEGKTWALVRAACAACFGGYNVQYDALEQSRAEIGFRVFTFASSEFGKKVFENTMQSQGQIPHVGEYKKFLHSLSNDIGSRFNVADTRRGPISLMAIAAQIERNQPDILFLDYLTLVDAKRASTDDQRWRSMASLSGGLKALAGQYQVPIIAAAQLNREAAKKGNNFGGPEDLAESDAIGRDADVVISMKLMSERVIAMKIVKNRHGRGGFVWYNRFLPNTGHFEEITRDEAETLISEDKANELQASMNMGNSVPGQRGSGFQVVRKPEEKPKKFVVRKAK